MKRILISALLLASPVFAGPYQEDAPGTDAPAGKAYVYKQSGGKPRAMEIYFPENHDRKKAPVPGVILFHGGAWAGGNLNQFRQACHYFSSRGLVAATVDYRMLSEKENAALPQGETRKRVCITDARSAIRWFKQHSAELGIDPARVIAGGGSAGGHIAMLATLNPGLDDPADAKDIDTSVAAYLLFNPAFVADDANDPQVDVMRYIKQDLAPAIVFFGTKDTWKSGWDAVYQKLSAAGNTSTEVWLAEGQLHGFFNSQPWTDVTLAEADRFLVKKGLLKGETPLRKKDHGPDLIPGNQ